MKTQQDTAVLSRVESATRAQLIEKANQFSKVGSLRGKFDVVFEDTTSASIGRSEKYQSANGEIIVQRPANIYLKIEAPVVKIDIAQMTSNGKNFRVAVLEDGGSGKNKKFLSGSNDADYSSLQKIATETVSAASADPATATEKEKLFQKSVGAFSNLRPQHFTDALLIKPLEPSAEVFYVQSEIFQVEANADARKNSPLALVNRGYYLLEELIKKGDDLVISRRFWFDRSDSMKLTRQQIFDTAGGLEADIAYGKMESFTEAKDYFLPKEIELTRPKEQYKMTLKYQEPREVLIGKEWKADIFTLQNRWGLPEVDLDKKLAEMQLAGSSQAKGGGPQ